MGAETIKRKWWPPNFVQINGTRSERYTSAKKIEKSEFKNHVQRLRRNMLLRNRVKVFPYIFGGFCELSDVKSTLTDSNFLVQMSKGPSIKDVPQNKGFSDPLPRVSVCPLWMAPRPIKPIKLISL